jgi:pimeloyl-ACP methyl ester carboxylesterase
MVSDGGLRAAVAGREARARYAASEEFDEDSFTSADWAALSGAWASLGADAGRAGAAGPDGLIDDDVAFVAHWGFDVTRIDAPVLLVQGGQDRVVPPAHAYWLMHHCPRPELWFRPLDGHVSILDACPLAMDWLKAHDERP